MRTVLVRSPGTIDGEDIKMDLTKDWMRDTIAREIKKGRRESPTLKPMNECDLGTKREMSINNGNCIAGTLAGKRLIYKPEGATAPTMSPPA